MPDPHNASAARRFRPLRAALAAAFLCAAACGPQDGPALADREAEERAADERAALAARVEEALRPEIDDGTFAGVVLAALDGEVVLERAYGTTAGEGTPPFSTDARFLIYSTTKALTATAVVRLAARGELDLDASIRDAIPEAPESWQPVTLHHLLTHASGIPDLLEPLLAQFDGDDRATLLRVLASTPAEELAPRVAPGSEWRYSNFGYQLLLVALERRTGLEFPEILRSEVFEPAGMADSGLVAPAHPGGDPRGAAPVPGLVPGFNGAPGALEPATSFMYVALGPGGAWSTARDLLRFDAALRDGTLLDEAWRLRGVERAQPVREDTSYGHGWIVRVRADGTRTLEHSGGNNGYNAQLLRLPERGLCVVVLSNRGFAPVGELARRALDALAPDAAAAAVADQPSQPR